MIGLIGSAPSSTTLGGGDADEAEGMEGVEGTEGTETTEEEEDEDLKEMSLEEMCSEVEEWCSNLTYAVDNRDSRRSAEVQLS